MAACSFAIGAGTGLATAWGLRPAANQERPVIRLTPWAAASQAQPGLVVAHAITQNTTLRSTSDFVQAWKESLEIPDLKDRSLALKSAILSAPPDAYPAAWEMVRVLPYSSRCELTPVVLEAWAARDPEITYAKLSELPRGELQDRGHAAVIAGHAARSPVAAMEKALNETDDHVRGVALEALGRALASHPEAEAHVRALVNLRGIDEGLALGSFFDERGQRQPAKALDELSVALLAPQNGISPAVVEAAFAKAAFAEPEKAFGIALRTPVESNRDLALVISCSYWLEADPSKALARIAELSPADRAQLADTIGGTLGHSSHPSINAWIDAQPDENTRVETAKAYALAMAQRDRRKALEWVRTLPSGLVRSEAEFGILSATTSPRAVTTDDSLLRE